MTGILPSLHHVVARHGWRPLHAALRLARSGQRDAYAAYRAGMRFRAASSGWSEERRRDWILRRLRDVVRYAASTSPFYRERFAAAGFDPDASFSFDDYARLPILERDEVRAAGGDLRSRTVPDTLVRQDATGGSTGVPTKLWTGPLERGWGESASDHFMTRIGLPPGVRIAYLWGHHLDPVARITLRDRVHDWLQNASWYDCLRLSDEALLEYHAELQSRRPSGMIAYASSLSHLADAVARSGDRPTYPTRAFVTGAEKLFDHQRERVQTVFGVAVHERYGGRDVGLLGFQLEPRRTLDFTVDWANVLVEPEDYSTPSSVIVTKLHADAMPMLRYRVGDLARFPAGSRPGWPSFILHEIAGRDVQRLWRPDGSWFHGLSFPHMLKDYAVREFQVRQHADLNVDVLVVPAAGYDDAQGQAITDLVRANLPGVRVELRIVKEVPRTRANKWQPVVSEASLPSPIGAT